MRYIDRTGKARRERGESREIRSLGALTEEATRIAEENGLGIMKTSWGTYRIIKKSGLGAYADTLNSLEEADAFLKNLNAHKSTKY